MKNENYWINRANQRMDDYILQSEETANEIAQAYYSASKRIENEMVRVVKGLGAISDDATALKYLRNPQSGSVIRNIKAAVNRMPDGPEKQEALTLISSPAYLFRMRRLQATIDNARKECNKLYKAELKETTAHLKSLYSDAFSHTIYDIDKGYNTLHTFSMFPASRVTKLLKSGWSGENYSSRIWDSTQDLADTLKEEMLIAFMAGASVSETARRLAEKFQTSAYQARRLVRTESNFIANQAEQDAYKRLGIEEYKFIATLDTRTSTICQSLDGRVFNVEDGKAGVNLPPMHPNCRSTTIMYDADIPLRSRAARDENGKRITVPGDMTYKEWQEKYHPELVDKSGESGIIKSKNVEIPVDDINNIAGMSQDIVEAIQEEIKDFEEKYDLRLDSLSVRPLGEEDINVPFKFVPSKAGIYLEKEIVINSNYKFGGSLVAFEERIMRNYNRGVLASKSVKDLMDHEMAHVLTFQECEKYSEFEELESTVRGKYVNGITGYSDYKYDGAECISEAYIKIKNGERVPQRARELVNEFVERWRKS